MAEINYSNPQVTFIRDENGNVLDTVAPSSETSTAWKTTKQIYKDDSGNWVASPQASVSLTDNGDIKITAPRSYFTNESLSSLMDESALTQISKLYKANPDAKISNPFNDAEGEEITIPEFIEAYDSALKDYAAIQYGTNLTRSSQREDLGDRANDITENQYIMMNTTAAETDATDSSYLSIPTSILEAFPSLKNLGSYKNNFLTRGDFLSFYNLDNTSREDILRVHDIVDEYFAKGDYSDLDEYARMYAFRRFIKTVEPSAGFWSSAGLTAEAAAVGGATGVGKFTTGVLNLLETAWNGVMFINQANPVVAPVALATGGFKGYGEALGSASFFKGLDEGLQQHISEQQEDYYQLQHNVASIYRLSEMGAEIAANMATGKVVASIITNSALLSSAQQIATETGQGIDAAMQIARAQGGGQALNAIGSVADGRSAAQVLNDALMTNLTGTANPNKLQLLKALATTDGSYIYNSINTLVKGSAAASYGLENVARGAASVSVAFVSDAGATVDAAALQSAAALEAAEALKATMDTSLKTLRSSLSTASVQNFFAQVAVDAASSDGLAWRKYLDGDPDAEDLSELMWRTSVNASIYASALGVGRLITRVPATEAAQKANVKARKKVYSVGETVAKWGDDIKSHLPAVLKRQSAATKRAAQYSDLLRGANKIVAETGDATKKIAMESVLDNMWFGVNNRVAQYYSDYYPDMKAAGVARADAEKGLTKLLNEAGIAPEAPIAVTGKGVAVNLSVPQDLIDYAYDLEMVRRTKTYTPEQIAVELTYGRDIAKSKEVAEARIAKVKEKYSSGILDYIENTWLPAYRELAYQGNRIANERNVIDKPWYEGVVSSGHFGKNGELWLPARTITQSQEQQMNARNSLSRELSGDLPNKNQPEQWSYSYDGKEHHYTHPSIVIDGAIRSTASRDLRREGLKAGIDIYGQDVLFTGEENVAAQTYKKNRGAIEKASKGAIKQVSEDLAVSSLAKTAVKRVDAKKLQKKIDAKTERVEGLMGGDAPVKTTKTDRARAVESFSEAQLEELLGDGTVRALTQTDESWKEFWKGLPRSARRTIRMSLESTADQTGFTLDKRAMAAQEASLSSEVKEGTREQGGSLPQDLVDAANRAIASEQGKDISSGRRTSITYDAFQRGMEVDPELETALNRALLNDKIKKECE